MLDCKKYALKFFTIPDRSGDAPWSEWHHDIFDDPNKASSVAYEFRSMKARQFQDLVDVNFYEFNPLTGEVNWVKRNFLGGSKRTARPEEILELQHEMRRSGNMIVESFGIG